jgi:hypothetical protein
MHIQNTLAIISNMSSSFITASLSAFIITTLSNARVRIRETLYRGQDSSHVFNQDSSSMTIASPAEPKHLEPVEFREILITI